MATPSDKKGAGRTSRATSDAGRQTSGRTGGKTQKAAPAKKSAAPKRRSRKKKSGGNGILLAFVAGLIIASAAFWFFRDASPPDLGSFMAGLTQQAPPGASDSKEMQQRQSGQPDRQGSQKGGGKSVADTSGRAGDASTGRPLPPVPSVSSAPTAPAVPPATEAARRDAARSSAVASALKDLQDLPYEEALEVSLDDHVRQMDYAVMQAAWLRGLAPGSLRLAAVEDRTAKGEHYRHQVIEVLPGAASADFIKTLRECLGKWAEGAAVNESGGGRWLLSVNGVTTHELRLYPGKSEFPTSAAVHTPPAETTPTVVSRPRHPDAEPRLVIVIDDLGASKSAVDSLLALDYPVTFAFWPHAGHTRAGAMAAHAKGREVIVHLPMEPVGYPQVKPGPNVLLTGMDSGRIQAITEAGIAAVPHAAGLNNHMGSRFTQSAPGVAAVLSVLKRRGLFMLDSLTHSRSVFAAEAGRMGVPHYRRNVFLDVEHSRAKVLEALRKAEKIALLSGQAVAIGHPLPETLAALKEWQRLRNKNVRIVRLRDLQQ